MAVSKIKLNDTIIKWYRESMIERSVTISANNLEGKLQQKCNRKTKKFASSR